MSAPRRSFTRFVVSIVAVAVAALSVSASGAAAPKSTALTAAAPSVAAASIAASSVAAARADSDDTPRTCGGSHYPPCPPKSSISISPHHKVHRGHRLRVRAVHFAPHKTLNVTVRVVGHRGGFTASGTVTTDRHGNAVFSIRIPKSLKTGTYTLLIKIGSTTKKIRIVVKR